MSFPLPRAAVFDWDNTLVDSWDAIFAAMNATLAHFDKPQWTMEEVRARCKYAGKDYFPPIFGAEWKKAIEIYYTHFNAARAAHAARARPGAGDLLRWLADRKIPAFVVSNKRTDYLRQEAEALGWVGYFVAIVGSTDVANNKPARDAVDFALARGGLKADDASIWFAGDTDVDMQCARNSGCTPVLVGSKEDAERLGVTLWFADCQALFDRLSVA